jgi:glycosyltransferase involved in cell wall biosynthesis
MEGKTDWLLPSLPEVCKDFFGEEKGIIMTIWDACRLNWLATPRQCAELFGSFPGLQRWAIKRLFDLWGYMPIDSSGPNDKLTYPVMKTILGFDRLLAYGPFGEDVLRRTLGNYEADKRHLTNLPHGVDSSVFYERDRFTSRSLFLENTGAATLLSMLDPKTNRTRIPRDDEVLIGIVCTNQSRKDIPLALETCSILARNRKLRVWLHTDILERCWSIPSLLVDYELLDKAVISLGFLSDEIMAFAYSACDITLGPGAEGFGLPIAESLACHTPCITGSYAGAGDFVPEDMQVDSVAFRYDGSYSQKRPVYRAEDWAKKAEEWIGKRAILDPRYDWDNLWLNEWEPWFREAAK